MGGSEAYWSCRANVGAQKLATMFLVCCSHELLSCCLNNVALSVLEGTNLTLACAIFWKVLCPDISVFFLSEQLDHDPGAPSALAWRRKLNSHADFLTEFRVTFMEAVRMVRTLSCQSYGIWLLAWIVIAIKPCLITCEDCCYLVVEFWDIIISLWLYSMEIYQQDLHFWINCFADSDGLLLLV